MSETERKQYEEASKVYADKAHGVIDDEHRDSDRERIDWIETVIHFKNGCEYAHSKIEEAEREAHNRAIDAAIKIVILDLFSDCGYESFLKVKSELKKLRK